MTADPRAGRALDGITRRFELAADPGAVWGGLRWLRRRQAGPLVASFRDSPRHGRLLLGDRAGDEKCRPPAPAVERIEKSVGGVFDIRARVDPRCVEIDGHEIWNRLHALRKGSVRATRCP